MNCRFSRVKDGGIDTDGRKWLWRRGPTASSDRCAIESNGDSEAALTESLAALNNATRWSAFRFAKTDADTRSERDFLRRVPCEPPRGTIESTHFNDVPESTAEGKDRRMAWNNPTRRLPAIATKARLQCIAPRPRRVRENGLDPRRVATRRSKLARLDSVRSGVVGQTR